VRKSKFRNVTAGGTLFYHLVSCFQIISRKTFIF